MKNENMPKDTTELFIKEYLELKDENRYLKDLCERDEALLKTEKEDNVQTQGVLDDIIKTFGLHLDDDGYMTFDRTMVKDKEAKGIADYLEYHGRWAQEDSHGGRK